METQKLFNLEETIAKQLLLEEKYPWEVLPKIHDFILLMGKSLDKERFSRKGENIWVAKSAKIAPTAYIEGPAIIDENAEIRHSAFIRGDVIVGKNAIVGNSTELKNCILFNEAEVPHFNYVGDSILGYKAHMGAGCIASNLRVDKENVKIKYNEFYVQSLLENKDLNSNESDDAVIDTGLQKVGAFLGDNVQVGCNSVLNPGTIIGRNTMIYPLSSVKGVVPENSIYEN